MGEARGRPFERKVGHSRAGGGVRGMETSPRWCAAGTTTWRNNGRRQVGHVGGAVNARKSWHARGETGRGGAAGVSSARQRACGSRSAVA